VKPREVHGVVVVDKPRGPTSHDVVARMRRALGTRRVGHAGTLDPMASGVLVVLAGEATKLAPYLTAEDKRYEARVALGVATDTLDAEGKPTETQPIPGWLAEEIAALADLAGGEREREDEVARQAPKIAAAIAAERGRRAQVPPAHSAIKVGGQRSYALARAGQEVDLAARAVEVRAMRLLAAAGGADPETPPTLDLELLVSKGYYVRSLARDLGAQLGLPAHLVALRRTASGAFTLERAAAVDAGSEALRGALIPLEQAAALGLPTAKLTEEGARRARLGQRLRLADFTEAPPIGEGAAEEAAAAWLAPEGNLVAVGSARRAGDEIQISVLRGFSGAAAVGAEAERENASAAGEERERGDKG